MLGAPLRDEASRSGRGVRLAYPVTPCHERSSCSVGCGAACGDAFEIPGSIVHRAHALTMAWRFEIELTA
jgi:hypothetical protein